MRRRPRRAPGPRRGGAWCQTWFAASPTLIWVERVGHAPVPRYQRPPPWPRVHPLAIAHCENTRSGSRRLQPWRSQNTRTARAPPKLDVTVVRVLPPIVTHDDPADLPVEYLELAEGVLVLVGGVQVDPIEEVVRERRQNGQVIADVERDRPAAGPATGLLKCCSSLESTMVGVGAPIRVALAVELPPTIDQMELTGLSDSDDVRRELTAEHPDLRPNPSLRGASRGSAIAAVFRARCRRSVSAVAKPPGVELPVPVGRRRRREALDPAARPRADLGPRVPKRQHLTQPRGQRVRVGR